MHYRTWAYCHHLRIVSMSTGKPDKIKIETGPPKNVERDWIGPPDKNSNIRPVQIYVPENETKLQRQLRTLREDTMKFNNKFWKEHNNEYFQRKELYVKTKLADKECKENEDAPSTLTPSEMSVFYRKFLNENYHKNLMYNGEWYRRNFSIFSLTVKVFLEKIMLNIMKK